MNVIENANDIVDCFVIEARKQEAALESLGRMICDVPKSGAAWQAINRAVGELQRAIRLAYEM